MVEAMQGRNSRVAPVAAGPVEWPRSGKHPQFSRLLDVVALPGGQMEVIDPSLSQALPNSCHLRIPQEVRRPVRLCLEATLSQLKVDTAADPQNRSDVR